jgi:hypothetical protein
VRITHTDDLRDDAADLGRNIAMGVAQNIVAVSSVLGEVESLVLEDANEVGEPLDLLLAVR